MKSAAIFKVAVASVAAGVLYRVVVLTAMAQPLPPDGPVIQGSPPPPQCGPGENGVTKDGIGCSVGPIFAHPFDPDRTPEQAEKEHEEAEAHYKIYCGAHPNQCDREARIHDRCRTHPEECFPPVSPEMERNLVHPTRPPDYQWTDESGRTYLTDPDTREIIKDITPEGTAPEPPAQP